MRKHILKVKLKRGALYTEIWETTIKNHLHININIYKRNLGKV